VQTAARCACHLGATMRPLRLYVHFKGRDVRGVELIHGLVKITKSAGDHRHSYDLHRQDQISISP
jgi:hypothetical protein